ncbi:glycosyltransferase family 39 protein [Actinoplanes teichomyceticus]|uniref:4-amino-4-deoxy-L-arabinose transferase-like glycosyltransferase n=1 Tax=Actinoplanes teichomyceticus TaxID=1867 RepID=A0A561VGX6_ACTTI|nr:glycosyltransferase family 39 protein [Actinoplanes teichomyceticus]TWG10814.1 4-amino-4-deoxy-L-arabinose transferase-like glycosyltransferase [Actinoplanes teichomyceticus]GIF12565.1 hypothetical protein Ate01nite_25970 [Actinoplanes teichomyceticus]
MTSERIATGGGHVPAAAAARTVVPPVAWPLLSAVAGVAVAVIVAAAGRYGPHRDELYFIVAGRHLAFGYDDQPSLVPLLARLMDAVAGGSLTVLRLPNALAVGATVLLTGLLAREFGGGRAAQALAAAAWATAPAVLVAGRMLVTPPFDILGWTAVAYLFARWGRTRDDRLLLALGPIVGLNLHVKTLPLLFLAALAVAVAVTGPREVLRRPALWTAALVAVAVWAPNLWWQAANGWPQFHKAVQLSGDGLYGTRAELLPAQLLYIGPPLAAMFLLGLWRLLTDRSGGPQRALGVAFVVVLGLVFVTGGHAYYPLGAMPAVVAAGAVAGTAWARTAARRRWLGAAVAANAALSAVAALPVLPVDRFAGSPVAALNVDAGEMIGWPELAATVAGVYRTLPPEQRRTAVVFAQNYGEAGALDRYGPALGLPRPYSGHVAFWRWGPPPDAATGPVIAVGWFTAESLAPLCAAPVVVTRLDNGHRLANTEQGAPVWLCDAPRQPWSVAWPALRHLG